jgi:hypothetical protein
MNAGMRLVRRRRQARPAGARIAVAIAATAGLTLLAAACGGSPAGHVARAGSTTTQSSTSSGASPASNRNGAIAFSRCMRSDGVPNFPDPDSSGAIPKVALQRLGVSSSRFQAAQTACAHLLPNAGRPPSQAQLQQAKAQGLRFARCVRSHGVPNFPDPGSDGRIPDPATVGIDQGAPKFQAANDACRKDRPPYIPSNSAYDAWAATHGS